MDWFRSYVGTSTDPKFRVVAKKSGARLGDVLAVWQMLLERACAADERGRVDGFDCESVDALLDLDDGQGCAIYAAMEAKGLVVNGHIAAWEKRQPKREREDNSTDRVRAHRERKKHTSNATCDNETPCNATQRTETPRGEESILIPPNPPLGGECEVPDSTQGERPEADQPSADPRDFPDIEFEQFWESYPRKEKKITAWKAWRALGSSRPGLAKILAAVCRFAESDLWQKENGRFVQQPHKWLEGRRWLDEPTTTADAQEGPPPPKSYSDDQLAAMGIKGPTW